ncbi:phage major tail tube protein [uncultured Desulfuromusa sp.]|uniref:phage major tail tube protein n=1 Tax=uncultured Desulfuromusa sp. TaxID=219183 RepID=UPI002AA62474|nr:phage major tail tube protein [uncultured Desulfuromusa sp.]
MAQADILKNLNLFVDGRGQAGKIEEFTPPKLTIKTEGFRAGGMDTEAKHDMGMEPLEASATLQSYDAQLFKLFGLTKGSNHPLTGRGAIDRDGTIVPVLINMRGTLTEIDQGSWKPGDKGAVKLKWELTYFKQSIDGAVVHEIDVENMIRIIDGTDQLADQRAAIGI